MRMFRLFFLFLCSCVFSSAFAANFPEPQKGEWIVKDFKFHTGETLPELRLAYTTIGDPKNEAVLILHGTTGSAQNMLGDGFAGELFGPNQPLDAQRYFIILPDSIGTGRSSKPSNGLRAKFPRYNYDDMVHAQYRLLTEHLKIKHVRIIIGNSMGGMQTWLWAEKYPDFMDIAVPMASLPIEMSGRNWMTRRLIIDSIKNDPAWKGGDYTEQPKSAQFASVFYAISTNGGNQALFKAAPTREKADELLNKRLGATFTLDANDVLYQWDASRDYNPGPALEKIKARVFVINSADDERNPPELGILEREMKRIKNAQALVIPGSETTGGHGTVMQAKLWKSHIEAILKTTSQR